MRVQLHYLAARCFLEPGQLMGDLPRIAQLPAIVVQGRRDLVCPPVTAYTLAQAWPAARLWMVEEAGHSAMHPGAARSAGAGHGGLQGRSAPAVMSLRVRLNLIITALIALFTLVTGKIVVDDMRNSIREEIEAGTRVTMQLLTAVLYESDLARQRTGREHVLLPFLENLGRVRAHEIALLRRRGSAGLSLAAPGLQGRTCRAGLVHPRGRARTARSRAEDAARAAFVITPDPSRAILDAWDDLSRLAWLLVGFLLVLNLAVFFLLGRSLRPVRTILSGLSQMEQGRYHVRLPAFALPEFDSIGQTFNRMADALEESHAENQRLALVTKQSSDAIMIHDLRGQHLVLEPGRGAPVRLSGGRDRGPLGAPAHAARPGSRAGREPGDDPGAAR